jgi:hypothetical protein
MRKLKSHSFFNMLQKYHRKIKCFERNLIVK